MSYYPTQFYKLGDYDTQGVPKYLTADMDTIDPTLINRLINYLPESRNLNTTRPGMLTSSLSRDLIINSSDPNFKGSDVHASFLYEGAGYRNIIGYYVFPLNGNYTVPTVLVNGSYVPATLSDLNAVNSNGKSVFKKTIIFPNASLPTWNNSNGKNSMAGGGNLIPGSKVRLLYDTSDPTKLFPNKTGIGFFVISNGWNGRVNDGSSVYSDDIFNLGEMRQTVLLLDPTITSDTKGELIIGFEDIPRVYSNSDSDFNDVVIKVSYTPISSFDTSQLSVLPSQTITTNGFVVDNSGLYFQLTNSNVSNLYTSGSSQFTFKQIITCGDQDHSDRLHSVIRSLKLSNNGTVSQDGKKVSCSITVPRSNVQNCMYYVQGFTNRLITSPIKSNNSALVDLQNLYINPVIYPSTYKGVKVESESTTVTNSSNTVVMNTDVSPVQNLRTAAYALGDPHVKTIYGKKYDLPNDTDIYALYSNGDFVMNAKLDYFYRNKNTPYEKLTFIRYVSVRVGENTIICDIYHPDVYCNYVDGKFVETKITNPVFDFLKPEDIPEISTKRIDEYSKLFKTKTFKLRYIKVVSEILGTVYVELFMIPHKRDCVSGVSLIGTYITGGYPKGALVGKQIIKLDNILN